MIRRLTALSCFLVAAPAFAGTVDEACNGASFAAPASCTCMQGVADEHLSADDQEAYVAVVQRQTTIARLAQTRGQAWTEGFVQRMNAFANDSNARCGVP